MVRFLGTLSTETYGDLKETLIDGLQHKENSIRAEAGASLAIICASEETSADSDDDSDDEGAVPVREALCNLMALLRKAIIGHIRVGAESLPHILLRMRDQVLKAHIFHGDKQGPCHPSNLDCQHRLEIVRHGLSDRDLNVCKVAEGLMKDWLEAHERTFHAVKADPDSVYRREDALIALLGDYNLYKRKPEDLIVLEKLVKCIFKLRTDIRDAIEFGGRKEWETVVLPERAFITRVFVQYCFEQDINDDNHDILPTVVDMAFLLEQRYNAIMALYEDESATEVSIARASFVLAELLRTSHFLDYTDHMGTHKMRLVIRRMLSDQNLPVIFISLCLDVLRALSADEKELIRIGIEIVQGVREHATDDEEQAPAANPGEEEQEAPVPLFNRPRWEMEPEMRQHLDAVDLRALHIARGLSERIDTTFKNLPALSGLYDDLILPMMKYADAALRSGFLNEEEIGRYQELFEEALCCISLSALVAETIAWMSYTGFKRRVNKEDLADDVRLLLLKGMFDIVLVYRSSLVPKEDSKAFDAVLENLLDQVTSQSSCPAALTIVCQGLAKLVMDGIIHDERSIYRLYAALIVPETADNAELRQSLHIFFQLYSHLHPYNQEMMAKIFMEVFKEAGEKRKSLDYPRATMVTPDVLCRLFEEYTAPPGEDAQRSSERGQLHTRSVIRETASTRERGLYV
ncbi:nuclear condensing complex subunit [Coprinopsis sp. MPI-PUGE-AT-0042]|nr:nuclear condensing complex subunit [Coprinopsis sp. MPI-PUGE-AT-0042]